MKITRDDGQHLIIESRPYLAWAIASMFPLGACGISLYMGWYSTSWHMGLLVLPGIFAPLAALVIYTVPAVHTCFDNQQRKVTCRRRWPLGSSERFIAYDEIQGVEVQRTFGRDGVSYRPAIKVRAKRAVLLSQLAETNEARVESIANRIEAFLDESRGSAGARTFRASPKNKALTGKEMLMTLAFAVILIGHQFYRAHEQRQEREARKQEWEARRHARVIAEQQETRLHEIVSADLRAADGGDSRAMARVAVAYANGDGVKANPHLAITWARKAAERGEPKAFSLLGHLHMKGVGVPQDSEEALRWYMKGAEAGSAEAHYGVSTVYYHGDNFPQDLVQAHAHMLLSARGRYGNAESAIQIIERKMSPEQREASRDQVDQSDRSHPGMTITAD